MQEEREQRVVHRRGGLEAFAPELQERPIRVLLVDDEESVRKLFKTGMVMRGFEVITANHGGEALRVLLTHPVDVVVTDVVMRPMDGLTFLSEALQIWPWLGTVVFSGDVTDEDRRRALALGVGVIIAKPVALSELIAAVSEEADAARIRLSSREGEQGVVFGQYQFSRIWELARAAMNADTRQEAIHGLVAAFSDAFKSIATAILTHESEREMLCMHVSQPLPPAFLDDIRTQVVERGQLLGYEPQYSDQGVDVFGADLMEGAPDPEPYQCVSIPLLGDGDMMGVLTLVVPIKRELTEAFMSFLYHATNMLSSTILALDTIRMQAANDDLTGFYNRRQLRIELASMWEMSRRYNLTLSLLVLDLDHFKRVNDTYGHLAGDQVLREMADVVRKVCRSTDVVGRYGGDEFVIVVPDATVQSLRMLAERLQVAMHKHTFCKGTHDIACTLSVGGASAATGVPPQSVEALFDRADMALYDAKHRGRDCVVMWRSEEQSGDGVLDGYEQDVVQMPPNDLPHAHVLIVDNDAKVRASLTRQLEALKHRVTAVSTGGEALDLITEAPHVYEVVIVDYDLEDITGVELLQVFKEMDLPAARIVITERATLTIAVDCMRAGADDFIEKPITIEHLTLTLPHSIDYQRLRSENRRYQENLQDLVHQRGFELREALKRARSSLQFSLHALVHMLDVRECVTGAHSQRVQILSIFLAKKLGLSRDELAVVGMGALLHDIGKIGIPDSILMKPGTLTEIEWEMMRKHPIIGYEILKHSPDLQEAAPMVLYHHEKFDGSGYPHGLVGDDIPLGARVFSLIDCYDAMRSVRPYKPAFSPEDSLREITNARGTQFDPNVVNAFVQYQAEIERRGKWDTEVAAS
jgi:diguanylate cyclase (GGDEF)-like protein